MIYYDLKQSDIFYSIDNYTLYFSSNLNLKRFISKYDEYRKEVNDSLYKRFKFNVDTKILSALALYLKIEKRGKRIEFNGDEFECLKI